MSRDPRIDLLRRSMAVAALGAGAALSLRAFLRPNAAEARRLLDWEVVRAVASERSAERGPSPPAKRILELGNAYDAMAAELAPLLVEVTEFPLETYPRFLALDRRGFIDANIAMLQRLLAPVEKLRETLPESAATALGRRVLDRYVGELLGLMSRRVLGQYDPVLTLLPSMAATPAGSALYLVEPNIASFERSQHVPGDSLRRWLILHELTHAWQFEQHRWLGEHLATTLRTLMLESVTQDGSSLLPSREVLRRLPDTVRKQVHGVRHMQAVMSVLEGYSNFVMQRVGRRHLSDVEQLEAAMHRRREQRTLIERLVLAVTGLELKMRQYEIGERFCTAVADKAGISTLNRVWESVELMPSLDEVRHPHRWLARTN
ncbi:MAG: hypothetical protein E6J45_03790 [Chloroflexi bacterium]|nr:MAG: hypothetical protein E6J45_03790 [Chloroflexota bacterium]